MTIGEALKQERQKLGMSKYEFSKGHAKSILLLQVILNILLNAIYLSLTNFSYPKNYKRDWIINIVILALILLFQLIGLKKARFNKFSRLLSIIFLNYILQMTYCDLFSHIADWQPDLSTLLNITWAIGYLLILIPNIVVNFASIKNKWLRFLAITLLYFSISIGSCFSPVEEGPLSSFNEWLIGSLVLLILVPIILHGWGMRFEFNLKSFKNNKFQAVITGLLILFSIWILCVHIFGTNNNSLIKLFTNFDFSLIDPHNSATYDSPYRIIFTALDAGISEEIWRYLMIITLAMILGQKSFQLAGSILISSVIFGLSHYTNAFAVGWSKATMNVIAATAWGIIMAIVLLYTGKIWLGMVLHATHDFLAFSLTPLALGNQVIEPWNWLNPTIVLFLALVLFLIFTLSPLKQTMQLNLDRLLKTQKQVKIS